MDKGSHTCPRSRSIQHSLGRLNTPKRWGHKVAILGLTLVVKPLPTYKQTLFPTSRLCVHPFVRSFVRSSVRPFVRLSED